MSLRRVGPGSAAGGERGGPSRNRRAFTLVELLVVIAIIGLLAALVLPAVSAMREAGRRTTCVNNQRQIAVAAQSFAEANRFVPGWRHEVAISGTTIFPAWPVVVLPFLERGPLYTRVTGTTLAGYTSFTTAVAAAVSTAQVSAYVCPSSPTVSGVFTSLVYAGNCGSASNLRRFDGVMLDTTGTTRVAGGLQGRVSMTDIAAKDGASNTLLIAEKSSTTLLGPNGGGAGNWNTTTASGTSFTFASGTGSVPGVGLAATTSPPIMPLNLAVLGSGTTDAGVVNAPSSNHPGGVVAALCDGGVRFVSDSVTSSVYAQLLSWSHTEASSVSSVYTGWSPKTPLADSDY